MLGFWDYTVVVTYLSLFSASVGIFMTLDENGHPYIGMMFLMISGFLDLFDGKIARTKKNRTQQEKRFGIQIDSLTDLIAFGVLPACIGAALSNRINIYAFYSISLLYILAALVRLAYFNVSEEYRQDKEDTKRKYYEGLPVTSSAIIFPLLLTVQYFTGYDLTIAFYVLMVVVSILFVSKIKIKKW